MRCTWRRGALERSAGILAETPDLSPAPRDRGERPTLERVLSPNRDRTTSARPEKRAAPGTSRKRVLLVLPDLRGGGAERTSLNVRRALEGGPLDVEIVLMDARGEYLESPEHRDWMLPPGAWLRAIARRCPPDSPQRALLQVPQMIRLLWAERPDVVMTSMADISIPMRVALALLPRRLRPFWIVRDGNNAKVVLEEAYPQPALLRVVERLFVWAYRSADVVLTPSRGVGECLERDYGIAPERIQVIGNPIDIERVRANAKQEPTLALPPRYVVAVGRLAEQKGIDLLIRALARLDDRDVSLVLCGVGPKRGELEALARELGLGGRVVFAGFQANPWSIMARAEAFCLPSRWEGFGHVVVEALACGTPVVIADCDFGPGEIVRDGIEGWVVPPEDDAAFAAALAALLADPVRARERARAGELRAEAFDIAPISAAYERLFASGRAYRAFEDGPAERNPLDAS